MSYFRARITLKKYNDGTEDIEKDEKVSVQKQFQHFPSKNTKNSYLFFYSTSS